MYTETSSKIERSDWVRVAFMVGDRNEAQIVAFYPPVHRRPGLGTRVVSHPFKEPHVGSVPVVNLQRHE
jgi:hypothetical protein